MTPSITTPSITTPSITTSPNQTSPKPLRAACALLSCLVLLSLAACMPTRPTQVAAPPRDTVLLVSIDAFRADYIDRGISPNLSRIAREGVHAQGMRPSYPSLTFPNHYTLVTGLRPDHHGIVHNTMHDDALGDFKLSDIPAVSDARWWRDGMPIWASAEQAGLRTASWAWPGTLAKMGGVRPWRVVPFDENVPANARVDKVLEWMSLPASQRPRLVTLYFDMIDHAGHDHGPDSPEVAAAIREVDAAMGRLLDGLATRGELDHVNLIVVSDHGMATVAPDHLIAVEDMVTVQEAKVVSIGQVVGIAPNAGFESAVEKKLLGAHDHYECWRKQDMPARWHYGTHARIPPIVCQMQEGWDALPRETIAKRSKTAARGSHGYDPALPSMRALFLARGPAFARGTEIPVFDNVDVYPLLARLIGIAPLPNDGDITPLLPALRDAGENEQQTLQ
jgi:predicted AlkP superfamily pyrophosphatase or phosphodiesterase